MSTPTTDTAPDYATCPRCGGEQTRSGMTWPHTATGLLLCDARPAPAVPVAGASSSDTPRPAVGALPCPGDASGTARATPDLGSPADPNGRSTRTAEPVESNGCSDRTERPAGPGSRTVPTPTTPPRPDRGDTTMPTPPTFTLTPEADRDYTKYKKNIKFTGWLWQDAARKCREQGNRPLSDVIRKLLEAWVRGDIDV